MAFVSNKIATGFQQCGFKYVKSQKQRGKSAAATSSAGNKSYTQKVVGQGQNTNELTAAAILGVGVTETTDNMNPTQVNEGFSQDLKQPISTKNKKALRNAKQSSKTLDEDEVADLYYQILENGLKQKKPVVQNCTVDFAQDVQKLKNAQLTVNLALVRLQHDFENKPVEYSISPTSSQMTLQLRQQSLQPSDLVMVRDGSKDLSSKYINSSPPAKNSTFQDLHASLAQKLNRNLSLQASEQTIVTGAINIQQDGEGKLDEPGCARKSPTRTQSQFQSPTSNKNSLIHRINTNKGDDINREQQRLLSLYEKGDKTENSIEDSYISPQQQHEVTSLEVQNKEEMKQLICYRRPLLGSKIAYSNALQRRILQDQYESSVNHKNESIQKDQSYLINYNGKQQDSTQHHLLIMDENPNLNDEEVGHFKMKYGMVQPTIILVGDANTQPVKFERATPKSTKFASTSKRLKGLINNKQQYNSTLNENIDTSYVENVAKDQNQKLNTVNSNKKRALSSYATKRIRLPIQMAQLNKNNSTGGDTLKNVSNLNSSIVLQVTTDQINSEKLQSPTKKENHQQKGNTDILWEASSKKVNLFLDTNNENNDRTTKIYFQPPPQVQKKTYNKTGSCQLKYGSIIQDLVQSPLTVQNGTFSPSNYLELKREVQTKNLSLNSLEIESQMFQRNNFSSQLGSPKLTSDGGNQQESFVGGTGTLVALKGHKYSNTSLIGGNHQPDVGEIRKILNNPTELSLAQVAEHNPIGNSEQQSEIIEQINSKSPSMHLARKSVLNKKRSFKMAGILQKDNTKISAPQNLDIVNSLNKSSVSSNKLFYLSRHKKHSNDNQNTLVNNKDGGHQQYQQHQNQNSQYRQVFQEQSQSNNNIYKSYDLKKSFQANIDNVFRMFEDKQFPMKSSSQASSMIIPFQTVQNRVNSANATSGKNGRFRKNRIAQYDNLNTIHGYQHFEDNEIQSRQAAIQSFQDKQSKNQKPRPTYWKSHLKDIEGRSTLFGKLDNQTLNSTVGYKMHNNKPNSGNVIYNYLTLNQHNETQRQMQFLLSRSLQTRKQNSNESMNGTNRKVKKQIEFRIQTLAPGGAPSSYTAENSSKLTVSAPQANEPLFQLDIGQFFKFKDQQRVHHRVMETTPARSLLPNSGLPDSSIIMSDLNQSQNAHSNTQNLSRGRESMGTQGREGSSSFNIASPCENIRKRGIQTAIDTKRRVLNPNWQQVTQKDQQLMFQKPLVLTQSKIDISPQGNSLKSPSLQIAQENYQAGKNNDSNSIDGGGTSIGIVFAATANRNYDKMRVVGSQKQQHQKSINRDTTPFKYSTVIDNTKAEKHDSHQYDRSLGRSVQQSKERAQSSSGQRRSNLMGHDKGNDQISLLMMKVQNNSRKISQGSANINNNSQMNNSAISNKNKYIINTKNQDLAMIYSMGNSPQKDEKASHLLDNRRQDFKALLSDNENMIVTQNIDNTKQLEIKSPLGVGSLVGDSQQALTLNSDIISCSSNTNNKRSSVLFKHQGRDLTELMIKHTSKLHSMDSNCNRSVNPLELDKK